MGFWDYEVSSDDDEDNSVPAVLRKPKPTVDLRHRQTLTLVVHVVHVSFVALAGLPVNMQGS